MVIHSIGAILTKEKGIYFLHHASWIFSVISPEVRTTLHYRVNHCIKKSQTLGGLQIRTHWSVGERTQKKKIARKFL